ncbi:MAG: UbiA prenyltransferase family protein [Candidatus Micrarchaeota archaeon]
MDIRAVADLIRVRQWYKNLIIFAAAFFGGAIFNVGLWTSLALAFVSFSLVSGAMYCTNDIFDLKEDRKHEIKAKRALASGKIGVLEAWAIMAATLFAGIFIGLFVAGILPYLLAFCALTLAYSLYLKRIAYLDVIFVAANFLVRALAGAQVASVLPSGAFYMGIFLAGLFLAEGKRLSDLKRGIKTAAGYSGAALGGIFIATAIAVVFVYAIFLASNGAATNWISLLSFPFALFLAYEYYFLIMRGDRRGIEPVIFVFDFRIFLAFTAVAVILLISLYWRHLGFS